MCRAGRVVFRALLAFLFAAATPALAATLTGTFTPIATGSNVDLTMSGKLDWVHWGLYSDTSLNRKTSVTPQISNFALLGDTNSYLAAYQFTDNSNSYTWYDGSPVVSVTNTTTGVWVYGSPNPLGSGFQLTVPADTTQKTLQVFVGAFAARGKFTASLSDGSALGLVSQPGSTLDNASNGPGGVFTVNYAAGSTGQTLTATWTLDLVHGTDANVTLQAASLTAPGADNPPYVIITSPADTAMFPEPANITISANARDFDGNGSATNVTSVAFYSGTNKLGQATSSPYSFTWTNVPRGHYFLTAVATDYAGMTGYAQPVEVFVYGTGGTQANTIKAPKQAVDLTSEGTTDWTHWGLLTSASFDSKNIVPRKISSFTALGTNAVQQYTDNAAAFSWSDGTPTLSATNTATGVFITGQANGFYLTAPADTAPRQLRVYVGGFSAQGEFQAYLSDLSAQPYTDTSVSDPNGNNTYGVYTINYTAASPGQQLIVVYRSLNLFDQLYGNVTLQAATLQGGFPVPVVLITNPPANAVFTAPANVTIEAWATESGGSVTNVQFLVGPNLLANVAAAPYAAAANGLPPGSYTLCAIASDNTGVQATNSINITVTDPVTMLHPAVNGAVFDFSFLTQSNGSYTVQYAYSLTPPVAWQTLTNVVGNGAMAQIRDGRRTNRACFYRVWAQ